MANLFNTKGKHPCNTERTWLGIFFSQSLEELSSAMLLIQHGLRRRVERRSVDQAEIQESRDENWVLGLISYSLAFPSLSDTKSLLIRLSGVTFVISLAFHLSYFLSPIDYSISPAFPPFCSFYSIIGSFAVYRKDEKQKVLTTQASKIMCQAQKMRWKENLDLLSLHSDFWIHAAH